MRLPDFLELHAEVLIIAGRPFAPSTVTSAALERADDSGDFPILVGVEIARLLKEHRVPFQLLLQADYLPAARNALLDGAVSTFSNAEELSLLLQGCVVKAKPNILFLAGAIPEARSMTIHKSGRKLSIDSDGPGRIAGLFEEDEDLRRSAIIRIGDEERFASPDIEEAAIRHLQRGYAELSRREEGKLFAMSGVMGSFDLDDHYAFVR